MESLRRLRSHWPLRSLRSGRSWKWRVLWGFGSSGRQFQLYFNKKIGYLPLTEFPLALRSRWLLRSLWPDRSWKGRVSWVFGSSGRQFSPYFNKKYKGLAVDVVPSGVYAVIGLYGVCDQVGAERESLMSEGNSVDFKCSLLHWPAVFLILFPEYNKRHICMRVSALAFAIFVDVSLKLP
jgi:hypothetical protein